MALKGVGQPVSELLRGPAGVVDELAVDAGGGQSPVDRLRLSYRDGQVAVEIAVIDIARVVDGRIVEHLGGPRPVRPARQTGVLDRLSPPRRPS